MIRCVKCHRKLKRPPVVTDAGSFGPRCAKALYGAKPRRVRADRKVDARQSELFAEGART